MCLAPTLFSFLFSMMLPFAFKDSDPGIQITYRAVGDIFNTQHLEAKMKDFNHLFVTFCMPIKVLSLSTRMMTFKDLQILCLQPFKANNKRQEDQSDV